MRKKYVMPLIEAIRIEPTVMNIAGSKNGEPEDRADARHGSVQFYDDEEDDYPF